MTNNLFVWVLAKFSLSIKLLTLRSKHHASRRPRLSHNYRYLLVFISLSLTDTLRTHLYVSNLIIYCTMFFPQCLIFIFIFVFFES